MRSRIACSVALAALVPAATALAAGPTAAERAVAETLFRDGKKLMARGKVPEACEKFASSYKIDPVGGTLLNLAMCHEVEGKTATAWAEFNEALSLARKQSRNDRLKAATEHIAALEARLSRLTLTVPAAGADVTLDGAPVAPAALGTPIPVDPGEHVVGATAPGRKPWETRITLREGARETLAVPALVPLDLPPAPPPDTSGRWKTPAGIAVLGAGVVLLGVGTGFGVRAVSLGGKVGQECPMRMCSPDGWQALADGRSAATVANGTLIAGGVAAAAGTALLLVGVLSAPAPVKVGAVPVPGGVFLSAGGAF